MMAWLNLRLTEKLLRSTRFLFVVNAGVPRQTKESHPALPVRRCSCKLLLVPCRSCQSRSTMQSHEAALDLIPECVARESSVLPVSIAADSTHVIVPEGHAESSIIDKIRFVLNRDVTFDTAAREQIDLKVDQYYPRPGTAPYSPIAADADLPAAIPQFDSRSEFPFLDFVGQVEHSTPASVSFSLGRWSNTLQLEDSVSIFDRESVFTVFGWLDAHFPCTDLHRLFVRCNLPPEYIQHQKIPRSSHLWDDRNSTLVDARSALETLRQSSLGRTRTATKGKMAQLPRRKRPISCSNRLS